MNWLHRIFGAMKSRHEDNNGKPPRSMSTTSVVAEKSDARIRTQQAPSASLQQTIVPVEEKVADGMAQGGSELLGSSNQLEPKRVDWSPKPFGTRVVGKVIEANDTNRGAYIWPDGGQCLSFVTFANVISAKDMPRKGAHVEIEFVPVKVGDKLATVIAPDNTNYCGHKVQIIKKGQDTNSSVTVQQLVAQAERAIVEGKTHDGVAVHTSSVSGPVAHPAVDPSGKFASLVEEHFTRLRATLSKDAASDWTRSVLQHVLASDLSRICFLGETKMAQSIADGERHSASELADDFFISISTFPCSVHQAKRKYYADGYLPYLDRMVSMGRQHNPSCHWQHFQFFWDGNLFWIHFTLFPNKRVLSFPTRYELPIQLLTDEEKRNVGLK